MKEPGNKDTDTFEVVEQKFLEFKNGTKILIQNEADTKAAIKQEVSNVIYQAACIFEELERKGYISGNGHHAAQRLAKKAVNYVEMRWKDRKVVRGQ